MLTNTAYDLPLVTKGHNPHIYLAYTDMILRLNGQKIDRAKYREFFNACRVPGKPGLFYRWPGGKGGPTSHDEIMGAAYFSKQIALELLTYLDKKKGNFNSHGKAADHPLRWNVYRIAWLRPYLLACAGKELSTPTTLLFAAYLTRSMLTVTNTKKVGPGKRLRAWLMCERMRHHAICRPAVHLWMKKMNSKGISLQHDLRQEPNFPELTAIAPKEYKLPV